MKKPRILVVVVILFIIVTAAAFLFLKSPKTDDPQNVTLTRQTFKQPVDHSRPNGPAYQQEILILKPDQAGLDSPVFFILGNEGDATRKRMLKSYRSYGSPKSVIFIQAEHRGYGQSVTSYPDQSFPDYITIDRTLADYHRFIQSYKATYTGPWMAAGYSYGGGLVVDFAHRYPDDINVILASSAVIDWPFYMPQYNRQVKKNMGEALYQRMATHTRNLKPKKLFDQTWLEREFVTNMSIGVSQYSQYQSLVPMFKILSYLPTGAFVSVLRWADKTISNESGWTAARAFGKAGLTREEAITGRYNWYTWKYQQCKRVGTFWISESPDGLFTKSKSDILSECRAMFGEEPPAATAPQWSPRDLVRNLKVPVVYTIGGRDPWTPLCQEKTDWINDQDYFYAEEGFHCPDRDTPELGKKVLDRMLSYLN